MSYACSWKPLLGVLGTASLFATAVLRELDLLDMRLPLEELRQYLAAQFEKRNELHPRLLEEAVASVFRDHGFEALVTSYSRDGGIDVVLRDNDESYAGVQVKRTKNRISAEQIRSFVGALFVGGYTRGIYVTTSTFQPGALNAAKSAFVRGTPVELVDHRKLFDLLRIVRRQPFRSFEEWSASYPDLRFTVLEAPRLAQSATGDGYRGAVELPTEQSAPETSRNSRPIRLL
jgi:restriction endonuclease